MPASFFRGKRVLVTGHTGFKGGWLALWLAAAGADVTGVALAPDTEPSLFADARIGDLVRSIEGDIRDPDVLPRVVREQRPEVVFHLAAQALVRPSYAQPVQTYATNVMGTVHMLEAIRRGRSVRAAVIVTSDKCYENTGAGRAFAEGDPMGGSDPYSSSKGCAELVTAAYRRSFFGEPESPAVASARAGNVIGGGDWALDRIVPDIARAMHAGEPVLVRKPAAVRPWQHVLEPLRGYLMLAERLSEEGTTFAEAFNFGPDPGSNVTVLELAERFVERWGRGSIAAPPNHDDVEEAARLALDSTKARERLGWRPLLSLDEAVDLTVDWYRARHEDPAAALTMTERQIADYERRAS